jgi:hypothetical protein
MTRTDEQRAPEAIAALIPQLTKLTTEQPTTAEIEEAVLVSKKITRALFEWLAFRYSGHAQACIKAGNPIESPEERAELDRIERAHPSAGFSPNPELLERPA